MPREKTYPIRFTRQQLECLQRILELSAADASMEQMQELEAIDSQVYAALYPHLVHEAGAPKLHRPERGHPMPLRHLRIVRE